MSRARIAAFVVVTLICTSAFAQDWPNEPIIKHSTYQAVNGDGTSAYAGGFPIRLRGVLLNNPEDWLDATFQPTPGSGNFNLGAEWEVFVQAVDLDGTAYDPEPGSAFDDFGGTAAYMAQNYAGLPWVPGLTYSQTQWTTELDRLNYAGGTPGSDPAIRAGDLVEIRARGGLNFQGKRNVNEEHDTAAGLDFEIVLLEQGFGRPAVQPLTLDTFKDSSDQYLFDPTRQTGGERYQATWVELQNVMIVDSTGWGSDADLMVTDATGRTLPIHLGMSDSFDTMPAPEGWFNVAGIVNQRDDERDTHGFAINPNRDGYYLVALEAEDFVIIPEPASLMLMLLAGGGVLFAVRRNRNRVG
jgi:hypothetical protein